MTRSETRPEPSELDQVQAFLVEQLQKRRALPSDAALSQRARTVVTGSGRLSAVERLEIYREQFWLRHTSSLVEDFPGVSGILGQEAWQTLVEGYLEAHPPESYTLRNLGLRFPEYVASQTSLDHHLLCTDMARLELAYLEIFDAADTPPVSADALVAIPEGAWEQARITLHPALRLLEVEYPVAALRKQLSLAGAEKVPIPAREPQHLLLYRQDLSMFHEQLAAGAYALLEALTQRVPLVLACQHAQAKFPTEASSISENVGVWFQSWAVRGFITGVDVPSPGGSPPHPLKCPPSGIT